MESEEATSLHKRRSLPTTSMHNESRTLTKSKPKIRIIHTFAPEIIKADVSNFREIVQSLTGKQSHHHDLQNQKGLKRKLSSTGGYGHHDLNHEYHHQYHQVHDMNKSRGFYKNLEVEEETVSTTWNAGESSGGFLDGVGDFESFMDHHKLREFPYLPLDIDPSVATSSHLRDNVFAES